jgi:hypothetical protein
MRNAGKNQSLRPCARPRSRIRIASTRAAAKRRIPFHAVFR